MLLGLKSEQDVCSIAPYSLAISCLENDIQYWIENRESDPEFADITIEDHRRAIVILQESQ